jgi:fumarylpyruvate hydrolase
VGELVPAAAIGHPSRGAITLAVDGTTRQSGDLAQMIWKVPEIVATLSQYFTLAPGDVILTGTPAGVGPVERGRVMEAAIEGVGAIRVEVV